MESQNTFWHPCYGEGQTDCHCDWRITLTDCVERNVLSKILITCLSWNTALIPPILYVLYNRVIVKKRVIFERVPHTFFVRPKPIEAMLFWLLFFLTFRIINSCLLYTESDVNPIFKAVFFDVTWQCGLLAATCYVFGLAETASNSNEITNRELFISRKKVDAVFTALTIVPFTFNCTCSILSGIYARENNLYLARVFTTMIYSMWAIDCSFLAIMTLHFAHNIIKVFEIHVKNQGTASNSSADSVKSSMMRMKVISLVLFLNYVGYASVTFIYCVGRDRMMIDEDFNMIVCSIWNFIATVNVTLVLIILIFKPKLLSPLSFSSKSSNTEVLELSADKLEKGGKSEDVSTSHYKPFEETTSKTNFEEQKNFYNMVIESARNKVKLDDQRNSCRLSISQTNLISVEPNN